MAVDTKESIAKAAKKLLLQKGVRRLTVKEIVEECRITRQTFYYHFEDIPALVRWMLEQDTARTVQQVETLESGQEKLRYLFAVAVQGLPYVKKGMQSSYRAELEQLLSRQIQQLFEQICDAEGLFQDCTRFEFELILRYHSQAVLGLLQNWSEADTKNLDQIVRVVFRLMTGKILPRRES
ncbi:MAG TPA: TetR family transcriptional regulator [Candidatus Pygmaiobacter gallistercoris]|nr:TetR family transcriptional regulator [Candidatus Pygmaiobacter gallistercoris]